MNLACKSTPELRLAAHFLEPDDKFRAFHACFAALRLDEPDCDNFLNSSELNEFEKSRALASLEKMAEQFGRRQIDDDLPHSLDLKLAMERFEISRQPFIEFAETLKSDLNGDRFETFADLIEYIDGAVVAPLSIFCHIAACTYDDRGQLLLPPLEVNKLARRLGHFSALTRIMVDCLIDASSDKGAIIYFDSQSMDEYSVRTKSLSRMVDTISDIPNLKHLLQNYHDKGAEFGIRAGGLLDDIAGLLPPDGAFALNLFYELHAHQFRRLKEGDFFIRNYHEGLSTEDIEKIAFSVAEKTAIPFENISHRLDSALSAELI